MNETDAVLLGASSLYLRTLDGVHADHLLRTDVIQFQQYTWLASSDAQKNLLFQLANFDEQNQKRFLP